MSLVFIVKNKAGHVISKHVLDKNHPLELQKPQPDTHFEIQDSSGKVVKPFHIEKVGDSTVLHITDDANISYDVMVDNIAPEQLPPITSTDGVYTYQYDAENGIYALDDTTVTSVAAEDSSNPALGIAGLALGAIAAGIGMNQSKSHNHHSQVADNGSDVGNDSANDSNNAGSDSENSVAVVTDDAGNTLTNGSTTSDSTPTLSGSDAEPGATVVIKDGDTVIGSTTVDENGNWSVTPDEPLADGEHTITTEITGSDGSTDSSDVTLVVDTGTDTSAPVITDDAGNTVTDGSTTSDSTPTLSGSDAEPGANVVIKDGDTVIGSTTVDENGNWSVTPDEPLSDGEHTITTEITGEDGTTDSSDITLNVDTGADAGTDGSAPVITDDAGNTVTDGGTTTDNTPTLSGSDAEPGATVVIKDGDTVIGSTTVDEDGNWSVTPDAPLDDGEHTITTEITGSDGSPDSSDVTLNVDTGTDAGTGTDSSAPVITDDAGNTVTDGSTTSDSTPTLSGSDAEPGATVVIKDGDTVIGSTTVDEDGNWSVTPDEPLSDGEHTITTEITGEDGTTDSSDITLNVDTGTDTSAPVITDDAGNTVTDGNTTSDSTPTLSGSDAEPGATVVIKDGDTVIGSTTVDENGNWSVTPDEPLADGEHTITTEITGEDGTTDSNDITLNVDTGADAGTGTDTSAPVITDDAGNTVTDGGTTSDSTPTLSGSDAEPGATVVIKDGDTVIGSTTVDEDGNWSVTPDAPLADGEHTITTEITNADGSTDSSDITLNVDTGTDTSAPVITDDAGNTVTDGSTTSDSTPTLSGSDAEPGATVVIKDGDTVIGSTTVDENGNWSVTPDEPLSDGEHTITTEITGEDGTTDSSDITLNVDTGADAGTDGSAPVITDDAGNTVTDGGTTTDNTPTLSGSDAEPGATVVIKDGDTVIGSTTVDESGNWSVTPDAPLDDGEHTITTEITGSDGSTDSSDITLNVDTGADAGTGTDTSAPVITDDAGNTVTDGSTTSDSTPTLSGSDAEPGATVVIKDGDTVIGSTTVDENGNWSVTPDEPLDDGEHTITTEITNADGSTDSSDITLNVDTGTDTSAPVITDDAGNTVTDGSTTSDSTPTLSGSDAEPGATVVIKDGDTVIGSTTVDENGNWSVTPDESLADGEHTITTEITGEDGTTDSNDITLNVDTGADAGTGTDTSAPVITDDAGNTVTDGSTTTDSTPTLSGSDAEPGATVVIKDGDTVIGSTTVDENGNWSVTPDEPLSDGEHTITTEITGSDGSTDSSDVTLNVDTGTDTSAPVITDDAGNTVTDGSTTSDSTPTLSGSDAEPGATVVIKDGDTVIGSTTVDEDGNWSVTPDAPLADGEHTITTEITNADGSTDSSDIALNVDTGADRIPVITDDAGNVLTDGSTTSDTTPTLSGSNAEPGATVVIKDGDTVIGSTTVDEDGNWSVTPDAPLADGEHTITTEITNSDGSTESNDVTLVVDSLAPVMTDDEGNLLTDGSITSDSTPTLSGGNAQPGAEVVIKDGDTVIGSTTVDENGNWSVTPDEPLADGEHTITTEINNTDGSTESRETTLTVDTVDTVAPEAVDPSAVVITNDEGDVIGSNGQLNDATPTLSGSNAEPGTTVIVRDNGTIVGEITVDDQGNWTVTPEDALADGDHALTYEVVDAAGNSSGESVPVDYTVDTIAPTGVDVASVVITNEAGDVVTDNATQTDSKLTFSGSDLEAGTTVTVYDGENAIGQAIVGDDGQWTFTADAGLIDGSHDITFVVSDAAGNVSASSDALTVDVAVITLQAADNINSDASIDFSWPTETSDPVEVKSGSAYSFSVSDGTVVNLEVNASSSALLSLFSSSTLTLSKYDSSTGQWVKVSSDTVGNWFGALGVGGTTSTITVEGLTAGSYKLALTTSGFNIGEGLTITTTETTFQLADEPTITGYSTATGNVIDDADSLSGSDGIPHPEQTSVTSVSWVNADGETVEYAVNASGSTVIEGQYGTLTISANGEYSYEPSAAMSSIGKTESFTYTLNDTATGETSDATLYIHISSDNTALDVVWDNLEPSENAVLDTASANEADANVTLGFVSESVEGSGSIVVATDVATTQFTLEEGDFLIGTLTLTEPSDLITVNTNDMTITYRVQQLNSDGTWTSGEVVSTVISGVAAHGSQIYSLDLSTLNLSAGTYRIVLATAQSGGIFGKTLTLTYDLDATVVSSTDYVVESYTKASGNVLTDEGTDGTVDHISSIYTLMYVQAGDTTTDTDTADYKLVTESGVTVVGEFGTLTIYNTGAYVYQPTSTSVPEGAQDVFTYALKGANGVVVTATVTINIGVTIEGVSGGPLVFDGSVSDDVINVYDSSFASLDGNTGKDTLAWHGTDALVLSAVADKVANIEVIDLGDDSVARNVVVDAASIVSISGDNNSLYISGESGDTVTVIGNWDYQSTVVIDNLFYNRYVSTTDSGEQVYLYLQKEVALSSSEYTQTVTGESVTVAADGSVTGTELNDVFTTNTTDFTQVDGGEGRDTLDWTGTGTLKLADIADKVTNIEVLDLQQDGAVDVVVVDAQSVAAITDENHSLWLKGESVDTVTLSGEWQLVGSDIVDNVTYSHYTSTTSDGTVVNLWLDTAIALTATESASESNAADITAQVTLLNDSINNSTTLAAAATSSYTSDTFTVSAASDLQDIAIKVSGSGVNASNTIKVTWTLQRYNATTYQWEEVNSKTQQVTSSTGLSVSLDGLAAGEYRVVVSSTQSGYSNWFSTAYNTLSVTVTASVVSTTTYSVTSSSAVTGSVLTTATDSSSLLVKSLAAGIVTGTASYAIVSAAGTTIAGTYGTLTLHTDGSYTYTLNEDSAIKLTGSQDSFTYVLSDNTTHTLVMTMGVAVDGYEGGSLTFEGTVGNDSFTVYDTAFSVLNGESGHDTLIWNGTGTLNVDDLVGKVHNIEVIDLQDNGSAAEVSLTAADIVSITDDNNTLYIRGGSEDSIALQGVWERGGEATYDNIQYVLWNNTMPDGTSVHLYVEKGLSFVEVADAVTGDVTPNSDDITVSSVSFNGEETSMVDHSLTVKGDYGTFTIDTDGNYAWTPDATAEHAGVSESYSYTLSDGSSSTLTFSTGIEVDGSEGGALTFNGTASSDAFDVYDSSFAMLNGGDGSDTLNWHSSETLDLGIISAKAKNIEKIDLLDNGESDSLVVSAQSVLNVTDSNNTLYIDGGNGDTVTLNGSWESSGVQLVNGISYNLYTSTTNDGSTVHVYVNDDVGIG